MKFNKGMMKVSFIDTFINGHSNPNYFSGNNWLRDIAVVDGFMDHQEPGDYKITLIIEKVEPIK